MSEQGNGGIHSKFQERLRKIRLARSKKKKENEEFIQDRIKEIRKVINDDSVFVPRKGFVSDKGKELKKEDNFVAGVIKDIKDTAGERNYGRKKTGLDDFDKVKVKGSKMVGTVVPGVVVGVKTVTKDFGDVKDKADVNVSISTKTLPINTDKDKSVSIKEENTIVKEITPKEDVDKLKDENKVINKGEVPKRRKRVGYNKEEDNLKGNVITDDEKKKLLNDLGTELINKIKESFEDKLDELEVLESELYILQKLQNEEVELKKVKDIKKRINELVNRINKIIEQYNLYKKNYYIDNVIDIDDNIIVEDIINYRDLLNSFDDEKRFVKEYKALEEFKGLYNSLKEIRADTQRLIDSNEHKIDKYEVRDKKYDNIRLGMVEAVDIDKKCMLEIDRQNKCFKDLMSKISVIDRSEYVTYHMKGVGDLVGSSLKYMGLLIFSPLTGVLPGIAMQTLATRRMIGNAYQNLHMEEIKHVHYDAVNYESELNHYLSNVDYTDKLIEDTLKDVERLKEDFMMIYDSKIPGYDDTLKKIGQIENKLIHNQNKVSIIKRNLKNSKKINEDKLNRVRQLNNKQAK